KEQTTVQIHPDPIVESEVEPFHLLSLGEEHLAGEDRIPASLDPLHASEVDEARTFGGEPGPAPGGELVAERTLVRQGALREGIRDPPGGDDAAGDGEGLPRPALERRRVRNRERDVGAVL